MEHVYFVRIHPVDVGSLGDEVANDLEISVETGEMEGREVLFPFCLSVYPLPKNMFFFLLVIDLRVFEDLMREEGGNGLHIRTGFGSFCRSSCR